MIPDLWLKPSPVLESSFKVKTISFEGDLKARGIGRQGNIGNV